jgi:hypothetical protein
MPTPFREEEMVERRMEPVRDRVSVWREKEKTLTNWEKENMTWGSNSFCAQTDLSERFHPLRRHARNVRNVGGELFELFVDLF